MIAAHLLATLLSSVKVRSDDLSSDISQTITRDFTDD